MFYNFLNTTKTARLFTIYGIGVLQIFLYRFSLLSLPFSLVNILETIFISFLLLVDISVITLMVRKNQLSEGNLLVPFFWILLGSLFPEVYVDAAIIVANTCILFLFYQIISLRNIDGREVFFNASMLIFIASLFFVPSILSLLLLWIHILIYPGKRFRNMLIPMVSFMLLSILILAIAISLDVEEKLLLHFQFVPNFSLDSYLQYKYIPLVGILLLTITITSWAFWKPYKRYYSRFLIKIAIVGILGIILFPEKNAVGWIYLTFPTALSLTIIIGRIRRYWLRETLLWSFAFLSLSVLIFGTYLV